MSVLKFNCENSSIRVQLIELNLSLFVVHKQVNWEHYSGQVKVTMNLKCPCP